MSVFILGCNVNVCTRGQGRIYQNHNTQEKKKMRKRKEREKMDIYFYCERVKLLNKINWKKNKNKIKLPSATGYSYLLNQIVFDAQDHRCTQYVKSGSVHKGLLEASTSYYYSETPSMHSYVDKCACRSVCSPVHLSNII